MSHPNIIMQLCFFLIPLQPSSPSIMPPYDRLHPPACLIWTFRRVAFACGPRPCIFKVVICLACIHTNGSLKVSCCLDYVSLPNLVVTTPSVHDPTHFDEIDRCWEIECVSCKEIKVWCISIIEMIMWGGEKVECVCVCVGWSCTICWHQILAWSKTQLRWPQMKKCSKQESSVSSKGETFIFGPYPSNLISKAKVVFEVLRFCIQNTIRLITPPRRPRMKKWSTQIVFVLLKWLILI